MDALGALILGEKPKEQGRPSDTNVGNLRQPGKQEFQQFATREEGLKALDNQLKIYGEKHKIDTLRGLVTRYAPPSENDTENYIKFLSDRTGIKPDQKIDLTDPVQRHIISGPMVVMEKGTKNVFKTPQMTPQASPQNAPQAQESGDPLANLIMGGKPAQTAPKAEPQPKPAVSDVPLPVSVGGQVQNVETQAQPVAEKQQPTKATPTDVLARLAMRNIVPEPVKGAAETATTFVTGALAPWTGAAYGAYKNIIEGKNERIDQPKFGEAVTYQPKTESGKKMVSAIGEAIPEELQKIPLYVPGAGGVAALAKGAKAQAVEKGAKAIEPITTPLKAQIAEMKANLPKVAPKPAESKLSGAGSAQVPVQQQRINRANELPIPIDLEKSQITRDPADVRFARETAKDPVLGSEFQQKYAEQNAKIQDNLLWLIDNTGAEKTGVGKGDLGQLLVDVVEPNKSKRYSAVNNAYTAAREAGQMNELIPVDKIDSYLAKHQAEMKTGNAPVLNAVEAKVKELKQNGAISINDLEEVRKMVNRLKGDQGSNVHFANAINKIIDASTEGKGGELYRQARKLNAEYMREFENTPALARITAMKKGTTQRAVALEDLVDKSMIRGSKQEVQQLFTSLEKMDGGKQMINELKGAVAEKIMEEATKGVQRDINGRPYVSTAGLDRVIRDLDKSGKLEYIFGKKQAEYYRTLNEVTKDLQTVPQGTTNPSGTAATLLGALTEMGAQTLTTGVPIPALMIGKEVIKRRKQKKEMKKISEFINYGKPKKD